jgi:hypothetical protein
MLPSFTCAARKMACTPVLTFLFGFSQTDFGLSPGTTGMLVEMMATITRPIEQR